MIKNTWGPGPWQAEPDMVMWTDQESELDCMINRSELSGSLCGYVAVKPDHPWFGKDYDEIAVEVHGGLTFSDYRSEGPGWWLGFDCAHHWDVCPAMEAKLIEASIEIMRTEDQTYKDMEYVHKECAALVRQAVEAEVTEGAYLRRGVE